MVESELLRFVSAVDYGDSFQDAWKTVNSSDYRFVRPTKPMYDDSSKRSGKVVLEPVRPWWETKRDDRAASGVMKFQNGQIISVTMTYAR